MSSSEFVITDYDERECDNPERTLCSYRSRSSSSSRSKDYTTVFYSVHVGWKPGIYYTFDEYFSQLDKHPNPIHEMFYNIEDAVYFMMTGLIPCSIGSSEYPKKTMNVFIANKLTRISSRVREKLLDHVLPKNFNINLTRAIARTKDYEEIFHNELISEIKKNDMLRSSMFSDDDPSYINISSDLFTRSVVSTTPLPSSSNHKLNSSHSAESAAAADARKMYLNYSKWLLRIFPTMVSCSTVLTTSLLSLPCMHQNMSKYYYYYNATKKNAYMTTAAAAESSDSLRSQKYNTISEFEQYAATISSDDYVQSFNDSMISVDINTRLSSVPVYTRSNVNFFYDNYVGVYSGDDDDNNDNDFIESCREFEPKGECSIGSSNYSDGKDTAANHSIGSVAEELLSEEYLCLMEYKRILMDILTILKIDVSEYDDPFESSKRRKRFVSSNNSSNNIYQDQHHQHQHQQHRQHQQHDDSSGLNNTAIYQNVYSFKKPKVLSDEDYDALVRSSHGKQRYEYLQLELYRPKRRQHPHHHQQQQQQYYDYASSSSTSVFDVTRTMIEIPYIVYTTNKTFFVNINQNLSLWNTLDYIDVSTGKTIRYRDMYASIYDLHCLLSMSPYKVSLDLRLLLNKGRNETDHVWNMRAVLMNNLKMETILHKPKTFFDYFDKLATSFTESSNSSRIRGNSQTSAAAAASVLCEFFYTAVNAVTTAKENADRIVLNCQTSEALYTLNQRRFYSDSIIFYLDQDENTSSDSSSNSDSDEDDTKIKQDNSFITSSLFEKRICKRR